MAKIKIERSNRQIAQYQNTPIGGAALPINQIGGMVEIGFNALTKPIVDAAKLTKKQEDKNSLRKLKLETYSNISEALGKYNNETDIGKLTNFIKDLDPKNFENLIKDENKDVKQAFNNYLADTVDKNYDNLYSKIISNHTEQSYANDLDDLMSFDKMEASDDVKTRLYGAGQKSIFLNDANKLNFKEVDINERRPNDVLIMKIWTKEPMHGAVLLKDDMILHQKFESVSCSEYFNHYYRKRTVGCFRYAA